MAKRKAIDADLFQQMIDVANVRLEIGDIITWFSSLESSTKRIRKLEREAIRELVEVSENLESAQWFLDCCIIDANGAPSPKGKAEFDRQLAGAREGVEMMRACRIKATMKTQ